MSSEFSSVGLLYGRRRANSVRYIFSTVDVERLQFGTTSTVYVEGIQFRTPFLQQMSSEFNPVSLLDSTCRANKFWHTFATVAANEFISVLLLCIRFRAKSIRYAFCTAGVERIRFCFISVNYILPRDLS